MPLTRGLCRRLVRAYPRKAKPTLEKYVNKLVTNDFAGKVSEKAKQRLAIGGDHTDSTGDYDKIEGFAELVNKSGIGTITQGLRGEGRGRPNYLFLPKETAKLPCPPPPKKGSLGLGLG